MFEQIKLPYAFDALDPVLDPLTLETHYGKHHAAYTKNFNDLVAQAPGCEGKTAEEILANLEALPQELRTPIRNNGGGYLNHNLYFEMLSPQGTAPEGAFAQQVEEDWGSLETLKEALAKAAVGQFGSGYAWLVYKDGKLAVTASANQDNPLMEGCPAMLLALDVWEHAYYLKYKNLRADYVKAYFDLVDWHKVGEKFTRYQ